MVNKGIKHYAIKRAIVINSVVGIPQSLLQGDLVFYGLKNAITIFPQTAQDLLKEV